MQTERMASQAAKKTQIQIRGIALSLREQLRRRAERKGLTMSQYVIDLIKDDLERPTLEEWFARVDRREPVNLPVSAAELRREALREEGHED